MARIAGVDLPRNKHMDRALTYIYGIGLTTARQILDKADLPYQMNSDDLSVDDVNRFEPSLKMIMSSRVIGDVKFRWILSDSWILGVIEDEGTEEVCL